MMKILLGLIFFIVALVGAESQPLALPPPEPEPSTTERGASEALSHPPIPEDMKIEMAQMALGAFGIGSGPFDGTWTLQTQRARNAYQRIRGLPLTDDLNWSTFESLSKDLEEWRTPLVTPPLMQIAFSEWEKGNVSVSGTWMPDKTEGWNVSQVSSLVCWRDWNLCIEATAEYHHPSRIGVSQRFYVIDHWNETEIETVKEQNKCPVSALHIERSTEAVTATRVSDQLHEGCPQLGVPMALQLRDGYELSIKSQFDRIDRLKPLIQARGFALPQR